MITTSNIGGGPLLVLNLEEYDYLRHLHIIPMPQFKDIDITDSTIWALNPDRIYIRCSLLKNNLRLLYLAHLDSGAKNKKLMYELHEILNEIQI